MSEEFDLHNELLGVQENNVVCTGFSDYSARELARKIDSISSSLLEEPGTIVDVSVFDACKGFIVHLDTLSDECKSTYIESLVSSCVSLIKSASKDLNASTLVVASEYATLVEMYCFILTLLLDRATTVYANSDKETVKSKARTAQEWDWPRQKMQLLNTLTALVNLDLKRIIVSTSELSSVLSMLAKAAGLAMEDVDSMKTAAYRSTLFEIWAVSSSQYAQQPAIQSRVMQNLREEHLAEYMAHFLDTAITQQASADIADQILRYTKLRNDKDLKQSKAMASFLVVLSTLQPRVVIKQMVYLQDQLESESYTIRSCMMELVSHLIQHLFTESTTALPQIDSYYDILHSRIHDVNSYVRSKVFQCLIKLAEDKGGGVTCIPIGARTSMIRASVERLMDKSSNVRKNAVRFLIRMIETAPFVGPTADHGKLNIKLFSARLAALNATQLEDVIKNQEADVEVSEESHQSLARITALSRYYTDALLFCQLYADAAPSLMDILNSNVKAEVIEVMQLLVLAFSKSMEFAEIGVRKMVHKVWDKDASEKEGSSVRTHLAMSYEKLYVVSEGFDVDQASDMTANNIIQLVVSMSLTELVSFEKLLCVMIEKEMIHQKVITRLLSLFASKTKDKTKRRAALISLSMLGKADPSIINKNIELFRQIGLKEFGRTDIALARHVCIAFQQLGATKRAKGSATASHERFSAQHPLFQNLRDLILDPCTDLDWFPFAEQALNTIYVLSESPEVICEDMLRVLCTRVFGGATDLAVDLDARLNLEDSTATPTDSMNVLDLAKLTYLVGHVAMKQIVHIECIETEWKRLRYIEANSAKKGSTDELSGVTGTAEDEFSESILLIRERELLYSPKALLGRLLPLVVLLCSDDKLDQFLTRMAMLSLTKLMCVSAEFCDTHLHLLLRTLERSTDPAIRSNTVIGLGDMTVSFNSLIDSNISHLYNRLQDKDAQVKKNALMVLTHLILNGMIKVKGQISEMAKCLEDKDAKISDLAKLFFTELSTKDNAVYNNLPDIISNLSHAELGVDEQSFKTIMRFLLNFISKEKQSESIVEKLCARFKNAPHERQWRDISFCLSLLSFSSDKSFKKLEDALPYYQTKLHEPTLHKHLDDIIQKHKKKSDARGVEEFEMKFVEARKRCLEAAGLECDVKREGEAEVDATAVKLGTLTLKGKKKRVVRKVQSDLENEVDDDDVKSSPVKTTRKRRGIKETTNVTKFVEEEDEDEMESMMVEEVKTKAPVAKGRRLSLKTARPARRGRQVQIEESSDDDIFSN